MVSLLALVVVFGLVVYLIDRYVPMAEPFKTIFRVLIIAIIVFYLLGLVGIHVPLNIR